MIVMAAMNEAQKRWNANHKERVREIQWTSRTRSIFRERDNIIRDKDSLTNEFILDMVESLKR
jgi:ribosomal protein S20